MILRSAVRQALGKFSITPSIDFDIEKSMIFPEPSPGQNIKIPEIKVDPNFNPFETQEKKETPGFKRSPDARKGLDQWEKLYDFDGVDLKPVPSTEIKSGSKIFETTTPDDRIVEQEISGFYHLNGQYILTQIRSGLMIIHQQLAHERILYERLVDSMENENTGIQQQLFPHTIAFSKADAELLRSMHDEIRRAGFDIEEFGPNNFKVNGVPADLKESDVQGLLERVLESYKNNLSGTEGNTRTRLAASLARQMSVKPGKMLNIEEMRSLVDQLFACSITHTSPSGKKTFIVIPYEDLEKNFK
jgi:DNA mismatch repair protein MutL